MACLDENTILAFVDGRLSGAEGAVAEQHVASCATCSDLIAAAAGGQPTPRAAPPAPDIEATFARGASFGRYLILEDVGRGGMGEVYAAYDSQLDRRIALKVLHQNLASGEAADTARARLLREAKAIAKLSHPNVVVVYDAGAVEGRVFLAMEFIEGQTLASWLAAAPRGWREIREVFMRAGMGLAAAHDAGLVHRDFKPQNVMVGRDGSVRVMDFGLAREADQRGGEEVPEPGVLSEGALTAQSIALTRTGSLLGTPLYMAPEQFLRAATDARTDQFSFCVALYEALFGERPFSSDTLPARIQAVVAGRVREPPQKAKVPVFLRKIVLRGLSADPDKRFPAMSGLLESLQHDPMRRRRQWGLAASAVASVVAIAGAAQYFATRGQRLCRGADDKLAVVWEMSEAGARRNAVHRAFLATDRVFAEGTWQRVSHLLDDYSRRWSDAYTDACEGTHVRGDQSSEVLDLRMACYNGSLAALKALGDVLARSDAAVLIRAVDAAQALPPLDRCANTELLRTAVALPSDPAVRARVEAAQADLARVKAMSVTGQWVQAREGVTPVMEAARATGYASLQAEAGTALAWLEERLGDVEASATTYEQALFTALVARRDDIAVECAAELSGVLGYHLGRYDESARWDLLGESLFPRLGAGHDRVQSWLLQSRGMVKSRRGDFAGALADLKAGLVLKQKALPPGHPDIGTSWGAIANVEIELGDYVSALAAHDQVLGILQQAYGPDSPLLAFPLGNRGEVLEHLGRHEEAEHDLRFSVEGWTAQVGPDHPWVAYPLTALGKTLIAEARPREAVPILERALRIREHAEPNTELLAETRFAFADALWAAGEDRPRARSLAEAASRGYRAVPAFADRAGKVEQWLAEHSLEGGNPAPPRP